MSIEQHHSTELAIDASQQSFSPDQVAALTHIGVDKASEGDLRVFFHVVKRTGLDPFARQIYMIGRDLNERQPDGSWVKVTKQTIQTGIDGYRLIGRRAADRAGQTLAIGAPEWAHEDGSWRPVWSNTWGRPVAARVIVERDGMAFPGVALFDEYAQTKRDGGLTQMWAQRPAGMIAKCAEALAWRMAFPQDLSGVYTDDEMSRADTDAGPARSASPTAPADRMRAALGTPNSSPAPDVAASEPPAPSPPVEASAGEGITAGQLKKMGAAMRERGLTERPDALDFVVAVIGRDVGSRNDLTRAEAGAVIDALEDWSDDTPLIDVTDAEVVEDPA